MPPRPPSQQTDGQNSSHMSQSAMPAPGKLQINDTKLTHNVPIAKNSSVFLVC